MNSRRLIVAPRGQTHARHRLTAVRVLERGEGDVSCDQLFWAGNVGSIPRPGQNRKSSESANAFRFAPESGHRPIRRACPLGATSGLMWRNIEEGQKARKEPPLQ